MRLDDFAHFLAYHFGGDDDADAGGCFKGLRIDGISTGYAGEEVQGGCQLGVRRDLSGADVGDEQRLRQTEKVKTITKG